MCPFKNLQKFLKKRVATLQISESFAYGTANLHKFLVYIPAPRLKITHHHHHDSYQRREEISSQDPGRRQEEAKEEAQRKLWHLRVQSFEASAPRHRNFQQGDGNHELFCQRHLRANCSRGFTFGSLQQEVNCEQPRNSNCCQALAPRRVVKARRFRRN